MTVESVYVRNVDTAKPDETAQVAAQRMHDRNVGALVVVDSENAPVGIITDRDLAVRVVGRGHHGAETLIGDVMTASPQAVRLSTSIETVLTVMRSGPCRRVPVVDDSGQLVGLVSVDDVLGRLATEFNEIRQLLHRESPDSLAEL